MKARLVAGVTALLLLTGVFAAPASATYTVDPAYAAVEFATAFPVGGCCSLGPFGIAFDASNNVYVSGDGNGGSLYKFPPTGTLPFSAPSFDVTQTNNTHYGDGCERGMAFSKTGRLYLAQCSQNRIVELDPATGAVLRTAAPGTISAHGIATDPLSGDLFVASYSNGGVYRVADPDSATPTVTLYADPSTTGAPLDGLTIAPDGTIYVAHPAGGGTTIEAIAGSDKSAPPAVDTVATVADGDGVAVSADAVHPAVFVNDNDGNVTRVDLSVKPPSTQVIFHNDTANRGDFVGVGNDGCLYATQSTSVVKITNADGTCSLAPTSATLPLDVTVSGPGKVTSAPAGIDCGSTCHAAFDNGSTVTLTAAPDAKSRFTAWSGACAGTSGKLCQVTMSQAQQAGATFVANQPPVAAFVFAPQAPRTGDAVAFDGTPSTDADGTIVSYAWTFGDGGSGTGATPHHSFAQAGTYTVTLTVTDDLGDTATVSHAVTVSAPPLPPPAAGEVKPAVLQCTTRRLVLVDVVARGGNVELIGAADPSLAGQTVSIVFAGTGKVVAKAVVARDGSYHTTAPLPPRSIRSTSRARYQATIGSERSPMLKLVRRVTVTSISAAGGRVTIAGRIIPPLGRPVQPVSVRQRLTCSTSKVVGTFKPRANGSFRVSISVAGTDEAVFTLVSKVRKNTRNPKLFRTASLPRPVKLSP